MDFTQLLFTHVYFSCNAFLFGYYKGRGLDRGTEVEECLSALAILLLGVPIVGFLMLFDSAKKAALKTKQKRDKRA